MTANLRAPAQASMHPPRSRRLLGELLVDAGVLTPEQLAVALSNAAVVGGRKERLGQTVVRLGFVSEAGVASALADQLGLECVEADELEVDAAIAALVAPAIAERHRALPLYRDGDTLVVACSDPTDVVALDDLRVATGSRRVRPVVSTPTALTAAIRNLYSLAGKANELIEAIEVQDGVDFDGEEELTADDGPVVRLADSILAQALRVGASDVHVEPGGTETVVRYRIDGVLHRIMTVPRGKAGALLSRLKLMAGMDIAERRRPQDGRATFRGDSGAVDLRVSSLPSLHGETIVLRLLRKGADRVNLDDIGFPPEDLARVLEAIERPQGLVLITGPTGSGKTTTLYSFLAHLADEGRNLITLEDPIEYELPGVNQTQVNERIGFTFASALRSVLRQDPDIVMVGEIRDLETAELALQASLTGHLVFSTLHTNSAPGAIVRLRDLGVPGYLVASSVTLVLAQRLLRAVCDDCGVPAEPEERVLAQLQMRREDVADYRLRAGTGCTTCSGTGYRGRRSVFEILRVDTAVRELLASSDGETAIRRAARLAGMHSLREDALRLARIGVTTLEEVARVTPADTLDEGTCRACGEPVEPDYARCPWCGVQVRPDACTHCDRPLEAGWRLCPRCGTAVPGATHQVGPAHADEHAKGFPLEALDE